MIIKNVLIEFLINKIALDECTESWGKNSHKFKNLLSFINKKRKSI